MVNERQFELIETVDHRVKRKLKWFLGIVLVLGVGGFSALWVMAGSVASPARREIQDYHRSYLDGKESHGVVVIQRTFLDGKVPCLIARPDGAGGIAERGVTLRRQLAEAGIEVPLFGEEEGVLVLLHGRNGRKEDLLPVAERFCALGFVCVMPDLPSHGESPIATVGFGSREFEMELPGKVADAVKVELGLGAMPEFLWGISMGGSFAIHAAAAQPERWRGMVIVASFDRLSGVVEDSMGIFSGMFQPMAERLIVQRGGVDVTQVNPLDLAGGVECPVLVVHGDEDDLISHRRGEALHEALTGEKKFITVPGGNHDNVLVTEAPVYAEMAKWFLKSLEEGF